MLQSRETQKATLASFHYRLLACVKQSIVVIIEMSSRRHRLKGIRIGWMILSILTSSTTITSKFVVWPDSHVNTTLG
jgi:hypothetical protein